MYFNYVYFWNHEMNNPILVPWKALWSENVIGTYFFENDNGTTVTVYSERYGHMIWLLVHRKGNQTYRQISTIKYLPQELHAAR